MVKAIKVTIPIHKNMNFQIASFFVSFCSRSLSLAGPKIGKIDLTGFTFYKVKMNFKFSVMKWLDTTKLYCNRTRVCCDWFTPRWLQFRKQCVVIDSHRSDYNSESKILNSRNREILYTTWIATVILNLGHVYPTLVVIYLVESKQVA